VKANLFIPICLQLALSLAGSAAAQDRPTSDVKNDERIARVQRLLRETIVDLKEFPREMPLAKYLSAVEGLLPKDKKLTLHLDEVAFGNDLPRLAAATLKSPAMKNVTLHTVLRRVLEQLSRQSWDVDFAVRPEGVVITRSRLAAYSWTYPIHDVITEMPYLLPALTRRSPSLFADLKPMDGSALLVRMLMCDVGLRPWETMQVVNESRLVVVGSPTRQSEIADLLGCLPRLWDLKVAMNARLYEVDRAFYTKHVAPLFADGAPAVLSIDGTLFKKVTQHKVLLESEFVKLRPRQEAIFLSRLDTFRYTAGPPSGEEKRARIGTGTAGVSFSVRPLVSADRRYLRLRITQNVTELISIGTTTVLDVATGKDVEVESPNVRKTSLTGTVQLPDGGALLMPSPYGRPGKSGEEKVWLLVARPFIWIQEEVDTLRKQGNDLKPGDIWKSEVPKEEEPAPATPLPSNDEVKEILQAIIKHVLTDPDLRDTRDFYGTARDKTFTLTDGGVFGGKQIGWPKEFIPETHGFKLVQVRRDPFADQRRILGIRLDKFDLKQGKTDLFDAPIEVCLFNAGGSANGAVIGGCTVYYVPKRVGKRWTVECTGTLDP
jgi:hypothetical protein